MCGAYPDRVTNGDYAITGTVLVNGLLKAGAYVRLLNASGDFVAETPTGKGGTFTFYAAPGEWTVRLITATGSHDRRVVIREKVGANLEFAI